MKVEALGISGALLITPDVHGDDRGEFLEWYRSDQLTAGGRDVGTASFGLAQANLSVSRRGVVRGIHFADVPPGQAKYVTCVSGAVLDVVVDLRVGSATFGAWEAVDLDAQSHRAVFLPEGLGHGFCARTDQAVVTYLCSTPYNPAAEHGINPFDPDLAIEWPADLVHLTSPKDAAAPSLKEALADGLLPTLADCVAWYGRR